MENRIKAVKNLRQCLAILHLSGNPELWKRSFLGSPDEDAMQLIEAKDAELQAELATTEYKDKRKKEYPEMGDQLDAIWKHLNYRRMNGEDLVQEADDILGTILSVKAKYPKQ